jgi:copper(I)-binding protein
MKILLSLAFSLALFQSKIPTASDAWAEHGEKALLVYATINNPTMYDVYIVAAKSAVADKAELREKDKAVTSMTVPAFGSLELARGEARIRMSGIKSALKVGDTVNVTLETDSGDKITVAAVIK